MVISVRGLGFLVRRIFLLDLIYYNPSETVALIGDRDDDTDNLVSLYSMLANPGWDTVGNAPRLRNVLNSSI